MTTQIAIVCDMSCRWLWKQPFSVFFFFFFFFFLIQLSLSYYAAFEFEPIRIVITTSTEAS